LLLLQQLAKPQYRMLLMLLQQLAKSQYRMVSVGIHGLVLRLLDGLLVLLLLMLLMLLMLRMLLDGLHVAACQIHKAD